MPYAEEKIVTESPWQDGYERFELAHPDLPTSKHSSFVEYRKALGDSIDDLYVFATIRDPWSRMMSYFFSPHRRQEGWNRSQFIRLIESTPSSLIYLTADGSEDARSVTDLPVDFLLRFERLEADFAELCGYLEIEAELPQLNQSKRPSLFETYDIELVDIITERFRSEIEVFGYEPPA